jgi:hypothetical protein
MVFTIYILVTYLFHSFESLHTPEGRLHFGGTETAYTWRGYMDGAIESGHRVALEIMERENGTLDWRKSTTLHHLTIPNYITPFYIRNITLFYSLLVLMVSILIYLLF